MGKPPIGSVVSTVFPFSDLSSRKRRPALVVAHADFGNVILCQITSKSYSSRNPVTLLVSDFAQDGLPINSYVRPDKLFTADPSIISKTYGVISDNKVHEVHTAICALFQP